METREGSGNRCMYRYLFLSIDKYLHAIISKRQRPQSHSKNRVIDDEERERESRVASYIPVPDSDLEKVRFFVGTRSEVVYFPLG